MNRLVVNPDKPDAWEIHLKEGTTRLGRGDTTDFKIADASVSSSHCEIVVANGAVSIQDLGSTNGTFLDGKPTQSATLQNGQAIRLGGVNMVFYADGAQPAAQTSPAGPPTAPRLRVSIPGRTQADAPAVAAEIPPPLDATYNLSAAPSFCKFHPKNPAHWFCSKCVRSFCDLCVTTNSIGGVVRKTCRSCGQDCVPLEVEHVASVEKGFLAALPGAFIYPFRGSGVLVLIFGSLVFAGLAIISAGLFAILPKIIALGYLFCYMQNIIHATAAEETQMPEMPGFDDLFGGFIRLAGTVVVSFGLSLGLLVAKFYDVDIPVSAIIICLLVGCFYFPMAFLVVAMKDNVLACNPLVVVPSILRVPGQYIVTVFLFAAIFGVKEIGDAVSGQAGSLALRTTDMKVMFLAFGMRLVWSLISIYLLTVMVRILGLLYLTQKEKLGWY